MKLTGKDGYLNPRNRPYLGLLLGLLFLIEGVLKLVYPEDNPRYKMSWWLSFSIAALWFYIAWRDYKKSKPPPSVPEA